MENNDEIVNNDNVEKHNIKEFEKQNPDIFKGLKTNLQEILLQGESLSVTNRNPALDFVSKLTENQTDKLIDIFAKNEDNSILYHTKRLDAYKEIEIEKIKSKGLGINNFKQIFIGVLITFVTITVLLIFFKSEFLSQWFAFVVGLAGGGLGGFGLGKTGMLTYTPSNARELNKVDDEEK